jgi:hypothetical protein
MKYLQKEKDIHLFNNIIFIIKLSNNFSNNMNLQLRIILYCLIKLYPIKVEQTLSKVKA